MGDKHFVHELESDTSKVSRTGDSASEMLLLELYESGLCPVPKNDIDVLFLEVVAAYGEMGWQLDALEYDECRRIDHALSKFGRAPIKIGEVFSPPNYFEVLVLFT